MTRAKSIRAGRVAIYLRRKQSRNGGKESALGWSSAAPPEKLGESGLGIAPEPKFEEGKGYVQRGVAGQRSVFLDEGRSGPKRGMSLESARKGDNVEG